MERSAVVALALVPWACVAGCAKLPSKRGAADSLDVPGRRSVSAGRAELRRVDFQSAALGVYRQHMVSADFGSVPLRSDGLEEGRAAIVEEDKNRFLRVTYAAHQIGPAKGGVEFMVKFGRPYDELFLSYRLRFAHGFDFVKGGKLPGLVGGTAPTGCVADKTGFSARMMWRTGGAVVQYMYFPEKKDRCGDDYPYTSDGSVLRFVPGTWHLVEHHLVMNTPGQHDGVLQAWFDGKPALDDRTFLYRLADATFAIEGMYFSTFFGGGDLSWAPATPQTIDFDDFVFSALQKV